MACSPVASRGASSVFKMLLCSPYLNQVHHFRSRSLHLCHCQWKLSGPMEVFRSARFMKKLMTGSNRSRKKFFTVEQPVSKTFIEMGTSVRGGPSAGAPVKSKKCLRRVEVLNTVFMEQITSMLSTGEVSPELLGLGLTVSRVKMSNDFSKVNVYWVATGTTKDDIIEPLVRRAAGKLRHELTQLRVIGIVPPIEFVKDTKYSRTTEVEFLLDKCDFGEDFEPTTPANLFDRTINPKSCKDDGQPVESQEVDVDGPVPPPILAVPTTESSLYESISMRQDVLGVRHDVIMTQIKEMMTRVRTKKQGVLQVPERDTVDDDREETEDSSFSYSTLSLKTSREEVADAKKRQQDFFKYLKKQQLSKAAEMKQLTTEAKDKEFYDEEAINRWKKHVFSGVVNVDSFDEQENEDDLWEETYYSNSGSNQYR